MLTGFQIGESAGYNTTPTSRFLEDVREVLVADKNK